MQKIIVFASGGKEGGGSGFVKLVENVRAGILQAKIVAVVSNHAKGGVNEKAHKFEIPFLHFPKPWDAECYRRIVEYFGADWVALSGWLKLVKGLDPRNTFNIHPGPLPEFGGKGMFGHHVHEAVLAAFQRDEITHSAVSMHFVTEEYDRGPIFFDYPVIIKEDDTADTLGSRVNKSEHEWQSWVTNLVVNGQIRWDGKNPDSLCAPNNYGFLKE